MTVYIESVIESGAVWDSERIQRLTNEHAGVLRNFGLRFGGEAVSGEQDVFPVTTEGQGTFDRGKLSIFARLEDKDRIAATQLDAMEKQIEAAMNTAGLYYIGIYAVSEERIRREVGPEGL